ncbi:MAG: ABC transporter substrate-binding protein [Candidatus Thorarchaeota archaeon]
MDLKFSKNLLWITPIIPLIILGVLLLNLGFVPIARANTTKGELKNPNKFIWETISIPRDIETLDPAINYESSGSTVIEIIYETLVGYEGNSTENLQGILATNWDISSDGLKYTFTLRKNVTFHDGVLLNAYVMKYSLDRAILVSDPWGPAWMIAQVIRGAAEYSQFYNPNVTQAEDYLAENGIVVIDDYTLEINLESPYSPFIHTLAFYVTSAISPKAVIENKPSVYEQNTSNDEFGMVPLASWFSALPGYTKLGLASNHSPLDSGVVPGSHRHSKAHHTWMTNHSVGTGPYILKSINEEVVVLKKNVNWWDSFAIHAVDEIEIRSVPDDEVRIQNLKNGEADMIYIEKPDVYDVVRPSGEPIFEGVNVYTSPMPITYNFGMNLKESIPSEFISESGDSTYNASLLKKYSVGNETASQGNPFTSILFRKAFSMAFDASVYIDNVFKGIGKQMEGIIPEDMLGHHESLSEAGYISNYNIEAAKALFELVGWKGTIKLSYSADSEVQAQAFLQLANSIAQLNVDIEVLVHPMERSNFRDSYWQRNYPLYLCGWIADFPDPDNFVAPYLHGNYGIYAFLLSYNNQILNPYIEDAAVEQNPNKRQKMYNEIEEIAADDTPYIYLNQDFGIYPVRDWILNFVESNSLNPMSGAPNLQYIDKMFSSNDLDKDGMPDLWEFQVGLNVTYAGDAQEDLDGDWISNLDEYKAGTDPNNVWSFPIISLSIFHFASAVIVGAIVLIIGAIYFQKKRRESNFILRLKAPDYSTAVKIENLGFSDYLALVQAETDAKVELEKGNTAYLQCEFLEAIQCYEKALDVFDLLDNDDMVAETLFRIAQIHKETQILNSNSHFIRRLPKPPYEHSRVKAFNHMIQALLAESQKNWGSAEKAWKSALNEEGLSDEYQLVCQGALVESEFKIWLSNPSAIGKKNLLTSLNEWQFKAETNQYSAGMCQVYLLRAKINLATFQFDEVEFWLNRCLRIAQKEKMKLYYDIALKETEELLRLRRNISSILKLEEFLTPEEQERRVQEYVREAMGIKKGKDDFLSWDESEPL